MSLFKFPIVIVYSTLYTYIFLGDTMKLRVFIGQLGDQMSLKANDRDKMNCCQPVRCQFMNMLTKTFYISLYTFTYVCGGSQWLTSSRRWHLLYRLRLHGFESHQ